MYWQCVYDKGSVRVMACPFRDEWHIQEWMEGDNPRSYGGHYDYYTTKVCHTEEETNKELYKILSKRKK